MPCHEDGLKGASLGDTHSDVTSGGLGAAASQEKHPTSQQHSAFLSDVQITPLRPAPNMTNQSKANSPKNKKCQPG